MPEYILDHGSAEASKRFNSLDEFTQGYIEALFFTACDESDQDESGNPNQSPEWSLAMLDESAWIVIEADCEAMQRQIAIFLQINDLEAICDKALQDDDNAERKAGRDFLYTRNGHGCGFWDGDWAEPHAERLTFCAKAFRENDLYISDDGKLYLS